MVLLPQPKFAIQTTVTKYQSENSLALWDIRPFSNSSDKIKKTPRLNDVNVPGGVWGGGTLIFSYIRRLGPFFEVSIFEFQYFLLFF